MIYEKPHCVYIPFFNMKENHQDTMSINTIDLSDALKESKVASPVVPAIPAILLQEQSPLAQEGTQQIFQKNMQTVAPIYNPNRYICPFITPPQFDSNFKGVQTQPMTGMTYKPIPTWMPNTSMW